MFKIYKCESVNHVTPGPVLWVSLSVEAALHVVLEGWLLLGEKILSDSVLSVQRK